MSPKSDEERKAYFREYNKGWYQRHKERLLEKRRQHNEELRQWLRRYKSKLRCIECGESHPACIQFHHRDREDKSFGIGGIAVLRGNLHIPHRIGERYMRLIVGKKWYH